MDKGQFSSIKEEIKNLCRGCYDGNSNGVNTSILKVAKLFNIRLDESGYYSVIYIDHELPAIKIRDDKSNILYESVYTNNAELINCSFSGYPAFINVKVNYPNLVTVEKLFTSETKQALFEKIIIPYDDYQLIFEKEYPHSIGIFSNEGMRQNVKYAVNVEYNDQMVNQLLLTKSFSDSYRYNDSIVKYMFEHLYTYGIKNFIGKNDEQDKYSYVVDDSVIYGIQKLKFKDLRDYIKGICFENIGCCDVKKYLPIHIDTRDFPELVDDKYMSEAIFIGRTGQDFQHRLKVLKSNDELVVKYVVRKSNRYRNKEGFMEHKEIILIDSDIKCLMSDSGPITDIELNNIVSNLENEFPRDSFIKLVIKELLVFSNKIKIRKGEIKENIEALSPKKFINMTDKEIIDYIEEDTYKYFSLIEQQFQTASNINLDEKNEMSYQKKLTLKD